VALTNARALTGMLDVFGGLPARLGKPRALRRVSAYAQQQRRHSDDAKNDYFDRLQSYAKTHGINREAHTPVHFVGLWDTVKSAGTLTRQLRWPFTRQLPHARIIRHAVSIDECRRPFAPYLINSPNPRHLRIEKNQDLREVWFAGVHSDVGGMFATGTPLSDIPLKWMADEAVGAGLLVRRQAFNEMAQLPGVDPTGPIHVMSRWWRLLGPGSRTVPATALIHASVKDRLDKDPNYARRLPNTPNFVNADWRTPRPLPSPNHGATPPTAAV
jgi:uncharacterized protein (DUF2235 family)